MIFSQVRHARRYARVLVVMGCLCVANGWAQTASSGPRNARSSAAHRPLPAATPGVTAFVDVNVIPMDTERVLTHQTVLVKDGRITALGPVTQVRVPPKATRIDGTGKYLIPGLADMHAHLATMPFTSDITSVAAVYDSVQAERRLFLWVANGVTTIRNMDYLHMGRGQLQLRARAAAGTLVSPRIYTSGALEVAGLNGNPSLAPGTPGNYDKQVAAYKAAGYDFVKIHDIDTITTFDSVVAAAHRVGLPVLGHGVVDIPHLIAAHYRSIEHLDRQEIADSAARDSVVTAIVKAGMWSCPTEAVVDIFSPELPVDTVLDWPEMAYLSQSMQMAWQAWVLRFAGTGLGRSAELRRAYIKALQDKGAGILLGTDAPTWLVPGFSVHRELQALVRAGLTPYQALVTGTRNPALYFGTLKESGTVAPGKLADLVLLSGNPLEHIENTMTPVGVMLHGRWFPRTELDAGLAERKGLL